ncbi:hypothetical protein ACLIBH_12235 [Virgibacillus sp. W0430]|uniref:hypothetical protein n=1 Tax=Virgibacillus sp. W0430 TaxID=3391580 RepID=UPI003F4772BC
MAIEDHYLTEDLEQVSDNLEVLHTSAMNVLKGATTGDFELVEQSQISIERSRKILRALYAKKLKHDEFASVNYGIYKRRGWMN